MPAPSKGSATSVLLHEGVRVTPLSQIKASFPVLKNPANRHRAVGFTYEQWRYVFTNTFDEADARASYDRYHVPASGRIFWDIVLANFIPGPQDYKSNTITEIREFPGRAHLMPAQKGWEEIADFALSWAEEHATQ